MGNGPKGNFLSALLGAAVVAVVFAVLALSGTFDDEDAGCHVRQPTSAVRGGPRPSPHSGPR